MASHAHSFSIPSVQRAWSTWVALVIAACGVAGVAALPVTRGGYLNTSTSRQLPAGVAADHPCGALGSNPGIAGNWCFSLSEASQAESYLPFTPVRPDAVVKTLTGLTPTMVILHSRIGAIALDQALVPVSISYLYGTFPADGEIPMPSPPSLRYAEVNEAQGTSTGAPTIDRASGVAGGPGRAPHRYRGDWDYTGPLGDRGSLTVQASGSRANVWALGGAIAAPAFAGQH